jgi:histone deacetylase complex regulatory component SIN3
VEKIATTGSEITADNVATTGHKITAKPAYNQNTNDCDVAMTCVMTVKEQFTTEPEKFKKYVKLLQLYEKKQLGLS